MNELAKYITEQYNAQIIKYGISFDGFYYILKLTSQQQNIINNLEKHQIEQFIFNAKMTIAENSRTPLAQIPGTYEYSYDEIKLTGSKYFIKFMLDQLFGNIQQ